VSDLNLKLGDKIVEGKSNDLSKFGTDLSLWTPIRVETKNKKLKIFLHDQLIREEEYPNDAGEVVGLRFGFRGAGAVDHIKLVNDKGVSVY